MTLRLLPLLSALALTACATPTPTTAPEPPTPREPISALCPDAEDTQACSKHIAANQWTEGFAERETILATFAELCDGGVGAACF